MRLLLFLSFLFFLFACNNNVEDVNNHKPKREESVKDDKGVIHGGSLAKYVGKAGELLVVAENTVVTEEVLEVLSNTFGEYILPYYPPQHKFELKVISPEKFEKGTRRIRNVLKLKLSDDVVKNKPEIRVKKDFYAQHQLLTEIIANDMDDLLNALNEHATSLVERYESMEWKREFYRHKAESNDVVKNRLIKDFGISLELPKHAKYEIGKQKFAKIMFPDRSRQIDFQAGDGGTSKANFIYSGLMIWELKYTVESQFTPEFLMRARDTVLKYNALHEFPGVYMGTQDHPAVLPIHKWIKIGDIEGYEFKGMYKFTGRFEPSGGKFWSFHFVHPVRKTIIAISGYIDAPPTMNPAADLRKIQAVIYSLKIHK